jgi:hypothetical protein
VKQSSVTASITAGVTPPASVATTPGTGSSHTVLVDMLGHFATLLERRLPELRVRTWRRWRQLSGRSSALPKNVALRSRRAR